MTWVKPRFLSFRGFIQIFWPAFSGKHVNIFDYEFPPGHIYRLIATIQMTLTSDMSTIHRKYLLENSFHLLLQFSSEGRTFNFPRKCLLGHCLGLLWKEFYSQTTFIRSIGSLKHLCLSFGFKLTQGFL